VAAEQPHVLTVQLENAIPWTVFERAMSESHFTYLVNQSCRGNRVQGVTNINLHVWVARGIPPIEDRI